MANVYSTGLIFDRLGCQRHEKSQQPQELAATTGDVPFCIGPSFYGLLLRNIDMFDTRVLLRSSCMVLYKLCLSDAESTDTSISAICAIWYNGFIQSQGSRCPTNLHTSLLIEATIVLRDAMCRSSPPSEMPS